MYNIHYLLMRFNQQCSGAQSQLIHIRLDLANNTNNSLMTDVNTPPPKTIMNNCTALALADHLAAGTHKP